MIREGCRCEVSGPDVMCDCDLALCDALLARQEDRHPRPGDGHIFVMSSRYPYPRCLCGLDYEGEEHRAFFPESLDLGMMVRRIRRYPDDRIVDFREAEKLSFRDFVKGTYDL